MDNGYERHDGEGHVIITNRKDTASLSKDNYGDVVVPLPTTSSSIVKLSNPVLESLPQKGDLVSLKVALGGQESLDDMYDEEKHGSVATSLKKVYEQLTEVKASLNNDHPSNSFDLLKIKLLHHQKEAISWMRCRELMTPSGGVLGNIITHLV